MAESSGEKVKGPWLSRVAKGCERLALDAAYFTLLLPFGLFYRWFRDPLSIKNMPAEWLDRPDETWDIESARKP